MRVNLKRWVKANKLYVTTWISMSFIALGLVIHELGVYTLVLIVPFLPLFVIAFIRMIQELRK